MTMAACTGEIAGLILPSTRLTAEPEHTHSRRPHMCLRNVNASSFCAPRKAVCRSGICNLPRQERGTSMLEHP